MRVIIACEESQAVTTAFRELGHEAFSCDLLPCSGGHPEWHFQEDIFKIIEGWIKVMYVSDCIFDDEDNDFEFALCPNCFIDFSDCKCPGCMQDDEYEYKEFNGILYAKKLNFKKFDLMIAHPPCTYLAVSGAGWMYNKDGSRNEERWRNQMDGLEFVHQLMDVDIDHICIENPISVISSFIREPDQIIQPWMFGDKAQKSTCLWLKNLNKLIPTNIVDKGEFFEFTSKKGIVKKQPMWYYEALQKAKTPAERRTLRSKTFPGIANAMATQWSDLSKMSIQTKLF